MVVSLCAVKFHAEFLRQMLSDEFHFVPHKFAA